MRLRNSEDRYGLVAKLFHWIIAVLIIGLIGLGWYMVGLTYYDPLYHDSLSWHRSLGLIVLALVVARLGWMLADRRPRPPLSLTRFDMIASRTVHLVLVALMVVMPVSGYLISTEAGDPVPVFGLFSVPAVIEVSDTLRDLATEVHFYTVYGAAALVALHTLAALKHHFIDRDDVLRRMV
ncbi:Cytochrome B561 [Caenispirillum salinarum AK4]|uniref:Cytochrome B561 n=1 Tax=Caenispirillum salinarum AK4 TaxID=1238182 RepID=K9GW37_9PROT|nr:cytochrome b [Caenispirillum salinarum]EKV29467.1 Cytochrome B561 [Caenispirillum salinarum AK4]